MSDEYYTTGNDHIYTSQKQAYLLVNGHINGDELSYSIIILNNPVSNPHLSLLYVKNHLKEEGMEIQNLRIWFQILFEAKSNCKQWCTEQGYKPIPLWVSPLQSLMAFWLLPDTILILRCLKKTKLFPPTFLWDQLDHSVDQSPFSAETEVCM